MLKSVLGFKLSSAFTDHRDGIIWRTLLCSHKTNTL